MLTSPSARTVVLLPTDASDTVAEQVAALSERTGLPVQPTGEAADFALLYDDDRLSLQDLTLARPVTVCVDFVGGRNRHRRHFGGGPGQPLARAVGAKKLRHTEQILCDATGGFGRDALVFATLGCQVVILEQSPIVFELLADGIQRAQHDADMTEIAQRLQVYLADSRQLPDVWPVTVAPHTIYLDPMYPHSPKQAAAKKEMALLRKLLPGESCADAELLAAALRTASDRVVVKRPKNAPSIDGAKTVGQISSANTRYDLYKSSP